MLIQALLAGSLFARAAVYQGPVVLAGVSRADSSRLRRSAESAQRAFESFRRSRFPVRGGLMDHTPTRRCSHSNAG